MFIEPETLHGHRARTVGESTIEFRRVRLPLCWASKTVRPSTAALEKEIHASYVRPPYQAIRTNLQWQAFSLICNNGQHHLKHDIKAQNKGPNTHAMADRKHTPITQLRILFLPDFNVRFEHMCMVLDSQICCSSLHLIL